MAAARSDEVRADLAEEVGALGIAAADAAPLQHAADGEQLPRAAVPEAESPQERVPALGEQHGARVAQQAAAALAALQFAQRKWVGVSGWADGGAEVDGQTCEPTLLDLQARLATPVPSSLPPFAAAVQVDTPAEGADQAAPLPGSEAGSS